MAGSIGEIPPRAENVSGNRIWRLAVDSSRFTRWPYYICEPLLCQIADAAMSMYALAKSPIIRRGGGGGSGGAPDSSRFHYCYMRISVAARVLIPGKFAQIARRYTVFRTHLARIALVSPAVENAADGRDLSKPPRRPHAFRNRTDPPDSRAIRPALAPSCPDFLCLRRAPEQYIHMRRERVWIRGSATGGGPAAMGS